MIHRQPKGHFACSSVRVCVKHRSVGGSATREEFIAHRSRVEALPILFEDDLRKHSKCIYYLSRQEG